jgi:glycosyltransferase involved in cell wall biosynthesis
MDKIVHVVIACFYKNGFGYQENILPAKHKELGYDVEIITYNQGGDASYNKSDVTPLTYINPDGILVHVLEKNNSILRKIPFLNMKTNSTKGLFKKLSEIKPNIIFVHGISANDNLEVVKYKRLHPSVRLYADNHSDYYNAPLKTFKQKIYRKFFMRQIGRKLGQYSEMVWGVTPWRVKYQEEVYGVPPTKSALLVMGGDERKINWENRTEIRERIRNKLSIPEGAFVLITGGKIDKAKNIHLLVDAFNQLNRKNVYLIIFGRYEDDMKEMEAIYNQNNKILNLGWINPIEAYDYFLASDFAVFPGTHSVLWEQVCAAGIPALFKDWDGGFSHVNVGGNCILLKEITTESLRKNLSDLLDNNTKFEGMKTVSALMARKTFSYIEIAKRSIGVID